MGVKASEDMEVTYDVSAGLLLSPGLHTSFDDLEWSLYRRVSRMILMTLSSFVGFVADFHLGRLLHSALLPAGERR